MRRTRSRTVPFEPDLVNCVDLGLIPGDLPWGELSAVAGDAAYRYIELAARLAMAGRINAICTAPLNKQALHMGGHPFPGHTEMLAALTGVDEVSMMLMAPNLRVIHVTTHIGLIDAIAKIESGLVERTIMRAEERSGKIRRPRDARSVFAASTRTPARTVYSAAAKKPKRSSLPSPPVVRAGTTSKGRCRRIRCSIAPGRGDFDMVVAMYHDQGHGPIKVLGIEAGVNVTVGLPVIRTSVDHGTAFDIAGTGKADERSLIQALRQAVELTVGGHAGRPAIKTNDAERAKSRIPVKMPDQREETDEKTSNSSVLGQRHRGGGSIYQRDTCR